MTFMLGYAWKRHNKEAGNASSGHLSPAPLAIQISGDASIPDHDGNYITNPPTPEGLRPRKSLDTIREELELPAHVSKKQKDVLNFLPNLPPMPILPSKSFSPQVTNSSFYSRDSSSVMVAESPDLGHARTAVGALVAKSQGVVSSKPLRKSIPEARLGVLPPKTWEQFDKDEEIPETRLGVLPPRTWHQMEDEKDDEDISYQRLHDSMDIWSPDRMRSASASPESTVNSSILPSPSGSSWRGWQQDQRDVSFSSREGLVRKQMGTLSYNFDPIAQEQRQDIHDGPNYVVASDVTNVSILSQSSAAHNDSIHSLDSVRYSRGSRSQYYRYEQPEEPMEDALMRRKAKSQSLAKEQHLMGVVQRLQHSLDLVSDVDALHEDDRWFVKTPMDREGLLTGFSKGTRSKLLKYVRSVLSEMYVAQPEEFFLSPSQIESIAETHDDLHDALVFLEGMLQIAIPLSEQNPGGRWTCAPEIRSAMGITSIPESPESVHGGGTSVFSLPSESTTPHTSNMSMATTITSKPSLYRGTRSTPTHVQVRRTIEIVTTILQKMSLACHKLANHASSEDAIRATEEIKRNYLQLTALKSQDVRSVVDAFFVVDTTGEMPLARQVSSDEEYVQEQVVPPEPVIYNSVNTMFSPCSMDMQSSRIEPDDIEEYEDDDLRRQVGSNDYDDQVEERDAAPDDNDMLDSGEMAVRLENMVYYQWGASELMTTPLPK